MRKCLMILMLLMSVCIMGQECAQTDIQQAYVTFSINEHITISEAIYSLSDTVKVRFALGNLMHQPSTNTWKIASEQYDYVGGIYNGATNDCDLTKGKHYGTIPGSDNGKRTKVGYTGWLDLFKFDTVNNIRVITDTIVYRVPTEEEFTYLVQNRPNASKLRGRARIIIDDTTFVNGLMLLPDSMVLIQFMAHNKTFKSDYDGCWFYTDNEFTRAEWKILENQGIVFLPACAAVAEQGKYNRSGFYWTSTATGGKAVTMEFGGYWKGTNSTPTFGAREKKELRGIRLCYEIKQ